MGQNQDMKQEAEMLEENQNEKSKENAIFSEEELKEIILKMYDVFEKKKCNLSQIQIDELERFQTYIEDLFGILNSIFSEDEYKICNIIDIAEAQKQMITYLKDRFLMISGNEFQQWEEEKIKENFRETLILNLIWLNKNLKSEELPEKPIEDVRKGTILKCFPENGSMIYWKLNDYMNYVMHNNLYSNEFKRTYSFSPPFLGNGINSKDENEKSYYWENRWLRYNDIFKYLAKYKLTIDTRYTEENILQQWVGIFNISDMVVELLYSELIIRKMKDEDKCETHEIGEIQKWCDEFYKNRQNYAKNSLTKNNFIERYKTIMECDDRFQAKRNDQNEIEKISFPKGMKNVLMEVIFRENFYFYKEKQEPKKLFDVINSVIDKVKNRNEKEIEDYLYGWRDIKGYTYEVYRSERDDVLCFENEMKTGNDFDFSEVECWCSFTGELLINSIWKAVFEHGAEAVLARACNSKSEKSEEQRRSYKELLRWFYCSIGEIVRLTKYLSYELVSVVAYDVYSLAEKFIEEFGKDTDTAQAVFRQLTLVLRRFELEYVQEFFDLYLEKNWNAQFEENAKDVKKKHEPYMEYFVRDKSIILDENKSGRTAKNLLYGTIQKAVLFYIYDLKIS
jgi:hypothetical protein